MRKNTLFAVSIGLGFAFGGILAPAVPAKADVYFVPQGHLYAPGDDDLPPLGGARDRFNAQVDVRQSEIWNAQREERVFREQINRMLNRDFGTTTEFRARW